MDWLQVMEWSDVHWLPVAFSAVLAVTLSTTICAACTLTRY